MDNKIILQLIIKKLQAGAAVKISVCGYSMEPLLKSGDIITVRRKLYREGDILVFLYSGKTMLVHRLLRKTEEYFYCKGDNAFRTEQVSQGDVLGAVEEINGKKLLCFCGFRQSQYIDCNPSQHDAEEERGSK